MCAEEVADVVPAIAQCRHPRGVAVLQEKCRGRQSSKFIPVATRLLDIQQQFKQKGETYLRHGCWGPNNCAIERKIQIVKNTKVFRFVLKTPSKFSIILNCCEEFFEI